MLYRASRDGFGANDFHSRCDNIPNTISIVETDMGYIFGGFTSGHWTFDMQYHNDPNAFLFSLVNKSNQPFVSKVINAEKAILKNSSWLQVFGENGNGFSIGDKSKKSNTSLSIFKNNGYETPSNVNDSPNGFYLTHTKNFQVKEIEVFKIS